MYCMKCGRQLKDDDRFCEDCGAPVAPDASPSPAGASELGTPPVATSSPEEPLSVATNPTEPAPVSPPATPVAAPAPRKRRLGLVITLVVLALVVVAAAVFAVPMLLRTAPSTVAIGGNTGALGFDTDSPGAPSTRIQSVGSPSSQSGVTTPSVTPSGTP